MKVEWRGVCTVRVAETTRRSSQFGAERDSHRTALIVSALVLVFGLVVVDARPAVAEPIPPVCRTVGYDHTCTYGPQFDVAPADQVRRFVVPDGVGEITFDVRGGMGGNSSAGPGGQGGRLRGTVDVVPGQEILIGVGQAAERHLPGLPDGGAPGASDVASFVAGGGGGSSIVSIMQDGVEKTLFIAGGGGGSGAGPHAFGLEGGDGGDAGADGEKGHDVDTEGGYGGKAPIPWEGSVYIFFDGGDGGFSYCGSYGSPGGAGSGNTLQGGHGGNGGYAGGGGGGGGGSGGGGSGDACSTFPEPGVGGGGGGGLTYISSVVRDGVTDLNPDVQNAVVIEYTVAEGTPGTEPPSTFLLSTPPAVDTDLQPRFGFEASDDTSVVGYQCRLDDSEFAPCTSGDPVTVSPGEHTFTVRAVDGEGNVDPSPPSYVWTVREISKPAVELALHPDQANPTNVFQWDRPMSFLVTSDAHDLNYVPDFAPEPCLGRIEINGTPNHDWFGVHTSFFVNDFATEIEPGTWSLSLGGSFDVYSGTYRMLLGEGCFVDGEGDPSLPSNEVTFTLDFTPPDTLITARPDPVIEPQPVSIEFDGTDTHTSVATFECRLDGAAFTACASPLLYEDLSNGSHTVQVRAVDEAGNVDPTPATATFIVNSAPSADAGADVSGDEGSPIPLVGIVSDPDPDDTVTASWSMTAGAPCSFADPTAATTTITCTDNSTFTATLTADDGITSDADTVSVTVTNAAPTLGTIAGPIDPLAIGTAASVSVPFVDPGADDTHTCTIDWGDASADVVDQATSPCAGSHTYTAPGIYTVSVTVTDDDGGNDQEIHQYVVVYDPTAGFVTGSGWIDSPPGAYTPDDPTDPDLTGKASFGFVSRYKKGANVPDGSTQFQFNAAGLSFHSTVYQWLVVSGSKAQYKGSGTINGAGDYGFLLTAHDGQHSGDGVDRFRIKIWDKASGDIIYDNQAGESDDIAASDAIEGGSIVIHKGTK